MASTILLKRSATAGNTPTDSDLSLGELAINTHDGVVFFEQDKNGSITIRELENSTKTENVFYVSKSGSDSNDGTSLSKAFLTIDKALDAAARRRGSVGIDSDGAEGSVLRNKTERDLGEYIDASRFDILLNSNFNRVFQGRAGSYTIGFSEVVSSLTQLKSEVSADLAAFPTAQTRANAYWTEVIDIIQNGKNNADDDDDGSLEANDYPIPATTYYVDGASAETDATRTRDILLANKVFISEEVNEYAKSNFGSVIFDEAKCKRDIRFAVEALTYDAVYLGNSGTRANADFFHYDGEAQIPDDQKAATVDSYVRLKEVVQQILDNQTVTLTGNPLDYTASQNISLPKPTSSKITTISSLVDIIKNAIESGVSTLPTEITPISSASTNTSVFGTALNNAIDTIANNRATLISDNLDFIDQEFPLLFGIGDRYLAVLDAPEIASTIYVKTGEYRINNPLIIPKNVSLIGDNLKNTSIRPKNPTSDLFYVNNNAYVSDFTFRDHLQPAAAFAWNPAEDSSTNIIVNSPYIRNCTSITGPNLDRLDDGTFRYKDSDGNALQGGDGIRNDGNHAGGIRSMVVDSFTQINQGGKGVYLKNQGYCQLVSVFTVYCDVGFLAEDGGFASITNSNSSFGNIGLKATGVSPALYQANVDSDQNILDNIITLKNLTQRPNISDAIKFSSDPKFFTVDSASYDSDTGSGSIKLLEDPTVNLPDSDTVTFHRRSALSSSGHTFEWIGTGTNVRTAFPYRGGVPVQEDEVIQDSDRGGLCFVTSTDQKGDFRVGEGFLIQRSTGTIEGNAFDRSLFARVTPFSLALED